MFYIFLSIDVLYLCFNNILNFLEHCFTINFLLKTMFEESAVLTNILLRLMFLDTLLVCFALRREDLAS